MMTVDQASGFVCPFDTDFCGVASAAVDTALIVDDHKKDSAFDGFDSLHLTSEIDLLAVDPSFVPVSVVVVCASVLAFLKQDNSWGNASENKQDESPVALCLSDGMKRAKQMRAGDCTD